MAPGEGSARSDMKIIGGGMEKSHWTDVVSALSSLLTAIMTVAIPLGVYFWLDPTVRQAELKKQLLVSEDIHDPGAAEGSFEDDSLRIVWTLINPGNLYVGDVTIRISSTRNGVNVPQRGCSKNNSTPGNCIQVLDGYLISHPEIDDRTLTFKLQAPIPPRTRLRVILLPSPGENISDLDAFQMEANSDSGPAETLSGGGGGNI